MSADEKVNLAIAQAKGRLARPNIKAKVLIGDGAGQVYFPHTAALAPLDPTTEQAARGLVWARVEEPNGTQQLILVLNPGLHEQTEGDLLVARWTNDQAPSMLMLQTLPPRQQIIPLTLDLTWGGEEIWLTHQIAVPLLGGHALFDDEDEILGGTVIYDASSSGFMLTVSMQSERFLPILVYNPSTFTIPDGVFLIEVQTVDAGCTLTTSDGIAALYIVSNPTFASGEITSWFLTGSTFHESASLLTFLSGSNLSDDMNPATGYARTQFLVVTPGQRWGFHFQTQHGIDFFARFRVYMYAYESSTRAYPGYIPYDSAI